MRTCAFLSVALLCAATSQTFAQDIVSASSGVLQYFEGAVLLDGQSVEHKAAVFPSLKNGSTLRTSKGRAELLLLPGIYLRMDENTELKMVSNSLADTVLNVLQGTVILDSFNAAPSDAVALLYRGSEIRFPHPGIYRVDSEVDELQAYSGECVVKSRGSATTVDSTHRYYISLEMTIPKSGDGASDEFYDWAANRSSMLADQNQMASADQIDPDPTGAAGMFVVPPTYSAPVYATPAVAYSAFNSLYQNPQYQPAIYNSFIYLLPLRYVNTGGRWPVTTSGNRPVVTRWPSPGQGTTYRPPTTSTYKPVVAASAPRVSATSPRVSAPRSTVIGHH